MQPETPESALTMCTASRGDAVLRVVAVGALPPPIHGLSRAFELFVKGIAARGWGVDVVDLADRTGRRNASFTAGRVLAVLRGLAAAYAAVPRSDVLYVTIAHSRVGHARDALLVWWAKCWGKAVVLHHHGGSFGRFYDSVTAVERFLVRQTVSVADRVVVLSDVFRSDFERLADTTRVVVVRNASEMPVAAVRRPPDNVVRVLYLSNLLSEKGYRDVLLALPIAAGLLPGRRVEAHFAGQFMLGADGFRTVSEMEEDFRGLASDLPDNVKAVWHGVVDGDAKRALLADAHAFVLPTYYSGEGQPISVIEALRAALPVIATRFRGIPELLPVEHERLYVSPRNPAQIAASIMALAVDPKWYIEASAAAAREARRFDPDEHVSTMEGVLRGASSRLRKKP